MKISVGIVIVIILLAVILAVILGVIHKVRQTSMEIFGTESLAEGWNRQAKELAAVPKSISGMTRILEPQIQRDFPEFNWMEFKNKGENMLKSSFSAIEREDVSLVKDSSEELKKQVETVIAQNQEQKIREHYDDVQIHNTEITRYEKKQGTCVITLQSAVGYLHYKEREGRVIEGDDKLTEQTKYNIEILYIQDEKLANLDRAVGAVCPHCGAPVTSLGAKQCEYCGLAVTPINMQVWSLHRFYEVTYHNI